jgi:hypothetical protein
MIKQNLEQRISTALTNDHIGSEALAELVTATESAIEQASALADQLRERSLDIAQSPDIDGAAAAIAAAELSRDRLKAALPKLRDRLATAVAQEIDDRWHARRQRLEVEVDQLADGFAVRYPRLASAMIDLFQKMAASDRAVAELNAQVPAGAAPLRTAEQMARGLDRFTTATPSIAAQVQLTDHLGKVVWPVAKPVFSTVVQLPVVPHPGSHWHEALEIQAAERREEWERTVADHERRAKEQKEREEKEVAARIAEIDRIGATAMGSQRHSAAR